jgi:ankyrin repeat protein
MKTLQQVFDEVNRAGVFLDVEVSSVRTERFDGETALHMAAKWGDVEAIKVLVSNGADINKRGEEDFTPLHYAAEQNKLEAVKCLVSLGAANLKERLGNTAAQLAKTPGHEAVYQFLVTNGF